MKRSLLFVTLALTIAAATPAHAEELADGQKCVATLKEFVSVWAAHGERAKKFKSYEGLNGYLKKSGCKKLRSVSYAFTPECEYVVEGFIDSFESDPGTAKALSNSIDAYKESLGLCDKLGLGKSK